MNEFINKQKQTNKWNSMNKFQINEQKYENNATSALFTSSIVPCNVRCWWWWWWMTTTSHSFLYPDICILLLMISLFFSSIIPVATLPLCHIIVQKGLRRESNPGLPHPKREFYHLTTKPRHVQYTSETYVMSKRALPGIEPGPPVP